MRRSTSRASSSGAGSDDEEGGGEGGDGNDAESDPLYDQAVDIVLKNRRASISLVQRHLRIGYNRSARLIEAMEKAGPRLGDGWSRRPHPRPAPEAGRMMRRLILGVLLVLSATAVRADAVDRLRQFLETDKLLRADFSQTVLPKNGRKPAVLLGTMAIARPHKFRWQIEKPYLQLIVGDGEKVWLHDPELNQVTVKKQGAALAGRRRRCSPAKASPCSRNPSC